MPINLGTPLIENNGYAVHELYAKIPEPSGQQGSQTFIQWGYVVSKPDQSFSVFTDKISALQQLDRYSNNDLAGSGDQLEPEERILSEDVTSSPSTSSFITSD